MDYILTVCSFSCRCCTLARSCQSHGCSARSVKEDVAKLRASPLINKSIEIYGFVYDVKARTAPVAHQHPCRRVMYTLNPELCARAGRLADGGGAECEG